MVGVGGEECVLGGGKLIFNLIGGKGVGDTHVEVIWAFRTQARESNNLALWILKRMKGQICTSSTFIFHARALSSITRTCSFLR